MKEKTITVTYKGQSIEAADGKGYPLRSEPAEMLVWGESAKPTKRKVYGFVNGRWVVKHQQGRGVNSFLYAAELHDSGKDSPWVSFSKKHPKKDGDYLVYWPHSDGRPYYTVLYYNTSSNSWPGITDPENITMWYDAPLSDEVKMYFKRESNEHLPNGVEEPELAKEYNRKRLSVWS